MSNSEVRVRFAPSPTGYLHVGGLRTALFNYLFAKHNNGKFILRVEDTDQTRKVEGAVENIIDALNKLGLDIDEGPFKGGDFGPYYQSERLDIYKKYCEELLEKGMAYYAFETPEELDEMRKLQQIEGRQTMYDRRARDFTPEEVKEKLDSGIPYVIRLKVPLNEEIIFEDLIRGTIKIETNIIDDQVLLKADGFPTYHLANVIDDHLMEITHIIRGEEWVTSVPKHIILYRAFGWEVPKMAHLPLLLNPDKTKLSKRQGDVAVEDYMAKGYLNEALINFIALLGWHPGDGIEEEIFSMEKLVELFSLEKVHSAGAVFNIEKLNWMNNDYIKNYDLDKLTELAIPYIKDAGYDVSDFETTKKVVSAVRVYLNKLNEIGEHIKMFYQDKVTIDDEEFKKEVTSEDAKKIFNYLIPVLSDTDFSQTENIKNVFSEAQKFLGIKGKKFFQPLRIAITGQTHGPEFPLTIQILGKDKVVKFLSDWR
jgi:glutamyl-tRNA synthetase